MHAQESANFSVNYVNKHLSKYFKEVKLNIFYKKIEESINTNCTNKRK